MKPSNIKTEVNLKGGAPDDAIPFPANASPQFQKRTNVKLSFSSTSQNPLKQKLNSEIMKEVLP